MKTVRAIPGAGKNYIATLLSKHYHSNDAMHYDNVFNEYFHSPHLDQDENGRIKQPFWDENKWIIISGNPKENSIVTHEHEIWDDKSGIVKKFKLFNQSNGKVGLDPEKFTQSIKECYFIYCDEKEELDFACKLISIKINGARPLIVYDDETNSSTGEKSVSAAKLSVITSLGKSREVLSMLNAVQEKIPYKDWINIWREYCIFIQQFPYFYPFSYNSVGYIIHWLHENMSWDLCNADIFLWYLEECTENLRTVNFKQDLFKSGTEKKQLEKARQLQKENGMILHEIKYSDLFFHQKPTGTVLDNYLDDIKAYTEKNIKIIQEYENFYGKIL